MLHRDVRLVMIGVLLLISWQFLSLGAIVLGGGLLITIDLDPTGLAVLAMGAFFIAVGWIALRRLAYILAAPHY